jgi:hypothetical protein
VAHSLISVLLQQLQVPLLQAICCSCLQVLFEHLYSAVANTGTAGAAQSGSRKGGSAGDKQQLQMRALLAELLPPAVAALVQCVEVEACRLQQAGMQQQWSLTVAQAAAAGAGVAGEPASLAASYSPVALLNYLFAKPSSPGLEAVVQSLDLLPPLPVLSGAVASQAQLQQGLGLAVKVANFAARAAGMAASSRHRAARALLGQLQQSSAAAGLFEQQQEASSSSGGKWQLPTMQPSVVAAAYKLAQLGSELGDDLVIALAAQLLALAGPLPPDVITVSSSSSGAHSSSSSSSSDTTAFPMTAVMQQLADCLFSSSPHVVGVAQTTLKQLVAEVDVKALLASLQAADGSSSSNGSSNSSKLAAVLLQSYLATFSSDRKDQQQQRRLSAEGNAAAALAAADAAASPALWEPAGRPYNAWLCGLCRTLLRACGATDTAPAKRSNRAAASSGGAPSGTTLQLLADAAALRPQLAELLLPHALLKLCESDGSGADLPGTGSQGWAARLGAVITDRLRLDRLTQAYARSSRAGLEGGGWSAAVAGHDTPGGSVARTAAGVDVRCINMLLTCLEHNRGVHRVAMTAMPTSAPPAPTAWERCYCLHIDYLAVAAAAMSVRAFFTALLYVEQWCAQYTPVRYNPLPSTDADSGLLQLQQLAGLRSAAAAAAGDGGGGSSSAVQQQLLEQLLLDLYSHVNEPDGLYGVAAAFGGPSSHLQLMRHEQQWSSVLGLQDASMQAAAVQHQHQQGSIGSNLQTTGACCCAVIARAATGLL